MTSGIDEIRNLLSATEQNEKALETKDLHAVVGAATTLGFWRARDNLAFIVICAYIGVLCAIILYLGVEGIRRSEDVFGNMLEIIKIGFLPIVTLVIGFYFGTKSEQAKQASSAEPS